MESLVGRAEGSAKSAVEYGRIVEQRGHHAEVHPVGGGRIPTQGSERGSVPRGEHDLAGTGVRLNRGLQGPGRRRTGPRGQRQATVNRETTTTDSPSAERRIRMILDSMRPNDMRARVGLGSERRCSFETERSVRSTVSTGVVPRLLAIGLIERDGKVVLLRRSRLVRGDVDQLRHAGQLGRFVPRQLAELEAAHVHAAR